MKPQPVTERIVAPRATEVASAPFVTQGRVVRIKEQDILFSASRRAIFTLGGDAAEIWRSVEERMPPEAIAIRIAQRGVDVAEARRHVELALADWERLGLVRPSIPSPVSPSGQVSQVVAVHGLRMRIVYPAALAFPTTTIFRHLEARWDTSTDVFFEVVQGGGRVHLFRNGDWLQSCPSDELATVLKGQLLAEVLDRGAYELALHAAALLSNQHMLLLCGAPGAGKTTLTLALCDAGFGFASDDVTLLDSAGRGIGLPFAPAVKAGAWPLLAKHCPDLDTAPVFRRPDRKRVRYVVPNGLSAVSHSPCPVGWALLLRRGPDSKASLEPIEPAAAMRGLVQGAFAPGGELGGDAFDSLVQVIGSAKAFCLTYSRLDEAVELVRKSCR